ncbi:HAD hydrolase-like protein [Candidatus Gracilibacteria bacterium]|nr:HAD hydrolase-like protein [Candidatus Gracilibacteria bacterium]
MKKTIIFDVDGVITDSGQNKEDIIQNILEKYELFQLPGVSDIFGIGLNRILLLDKIYKIKPFDKALVLAEINRDLFVQESQVSLITDTADFIKNNYEKYDFFTNTSLPKKSLQTIFSDLDMGKYFMELLAYDDGSKKENIEYVMQVHSVKPENILFIDDKQSHIDAVKSTGVLTLLFEQDGVSLEEKINSIFGK